MTELFEKAHPGIVIALCGNKVDLEERQVSTEVNIIVYFIGSD
jgi:GTPase SAR1 family protein